MARHGMAWHGAAQALACREGGIHSSQLLFLLHSPATRALATKWPAFPLGNATHCGASFPCERPPAGRELAKFMASVQAMAYGSHNAELTSAMFRRMVETKVGCGMGCCFSAAWGWRVDRVRDAERASAVFCRHGGDQDGLGWSAACCGWLPPACIPLPAAGVA